MKSSRSADQKQKLELQRNNDQLSHQANSFRRVGSHEQLAAETVSGGSGLQVETTWHSHRTIKDRGKRRTKMDKATADTELDVHPGF